MHAHAWHASSCVALWDQGCCIVILWCLLPHGQTLEGEDWWDSWVQFGPFGSMVADWKVTFGAWACLQAGVATTFLCGPSLVALESMHSHAFQGCHDCFQGGRLEPIEWFGCFCIEPPEGWCPDWLHHALCQGKWRAASSSNWLWRPYNPVLVCKTPQASLASADGCLGAHLLAKDLSLSKMVESGWQWTIIQAEVEDAYPSLLGLIESACNSTNATHETQNEIQLMSAIPISRTRFQVRSMTMLWLLMDFARVETSKTTPRGLAGLFNNLEARASSWS